MKLTKKSRIILLSVGGAVVAGFIGYLLIAMSLPDVSQMNIASITMGQSTKIYDRTGAVLLAEVNPADNRIVIPATQIPKVMKEATISLEDKNFYSEPAFDIKALARAFIVDLIHGSPIEGGSTITQQLARNLFLTDQKSILRKVKELILAVRLEDRYSKTEILDTYLNYVAYGSNIYGVERASKSYFGIDAKDLSLNQAATLAAIPQSPNYYSPWGDHLSSLQARKNLVLKDMLAAGYISQAQLNAAGTGLPAILPPPQTGKAPHFVNYIEGYLMDKYGEATLQTGGLKVITTLDLRIQQAAESAVANGIARDASLYDGQNGALVAEDPKTGQILAMVGSKDYYAPSYPAGCAPGACEFEGQFNVATQGMRQPGSSLKPFVYMKLFEDGFTPNTILWDVPTEFAAGNKSCPAVVNPGNHNPNCYHPVDFEASFTGPVSAKAALAQSINVPAVKALYLVGIRNAISTLDQFGITTMDNQVNNLGLSLVLGGGDVRLIDMVNAYAALADNGTLHQVSPILEVDDNKGNVLDKYADQSSQVVDPNYAETISAILSSASLREPLFKASLNETTFPGYAVALKTGTTNSYTDAWAFGYTPDIAVGVWAGNNNNQPMKAQGSSILAAVPMWHDFLSQVLQYYPADQFPTPAPLVAAYPGLNNQYADVTSGSYHSVLYYLSRTGDPEFVNWEAGINNWLKSGQINLGEIFPPSGPAVPAPAPSSSNATSSQISISLSSPTNGQTVSTSSLTVQATINSADPLSKIEIYLNNNLIDGEYENLGSDLNYAKTFNNPSLAPQNELVVRATDDQGYAQSQSVIFYSGQ